MQRNKFPFYGTCIELFNSHWYAQCVHYGKYLAMPDFLKRFMYLNRSTVRAIFATEHSLSVSSHSLYWEHTRGASTFLNDSKRNFDTSCPVFSFTLRREIRSSSITSISGRRTYARVRILPSHFSSFFFSSLKIAFVRRSFCRVPVLCRDANQWFSINLASCKCRRVILLRKKRKKKKRKKETRKRARIGAYVRVHDRPNANVCTFHSFPQNVAKKRMYVIFFLCVLRGWRNGEKVEKERRW